MKERPSSSVRQGRRGPRRLPGRPIAQLLFAFHAGRLTGHMSEEPGGGTTATFHFVPALHEPPALTVLGRRYAPPVSGRRARYPTTS